MKVIHKQILFVLLGALLPGTFNACAPMQAVHEQLENRDQASNTPEPTPPPTPPPANTTNPVYPVYGTCESPATTFKRTIYVDPSNGSDTGDGSMATPFKTLAVTFAGKKILSGDHVVILPGDHGAVSVTKYTNPALENSADWLWLDFKDGASAKSLKISDVRRFLITGVEASGNSKPLVSIGGGSNFVIADSYLYTSENTAAWTVNDWIGAANGINFRNTPCVSILRNKILNVAFGIGVSSDAPALPENSLKTLIMDNEIRNFSGDGIRPIGSDILISKNKILDSYASAADGDDNHDDAIQLWALNGAVYDNIIIDGNYVNDRTSQTRSFKGQCQGISIFDGTVSRLVIRNNVVIVSAYHGVMMMGGKDGLIENNTVASSTPGLNPWVGVWNMKSGAPPINVIVRNNIGASLNFNGVMSGLTKENNYTVPTANAPQNYMAYDLATSNFDLRPLPGSSIDGKGAGAL
ncbi:MAG TPA: right-handed parallel beta-helix repeat-containing protein [Bdellovibrionales bacterium]|nr:right-handed parallel beta-helix repeat-containing protein [Bdellovibrionales bacterium]